MTIARCSVGARVGAGGLSWYTVLSKRENYRRLFDGFDPQRMATYDARKIETLLGDGDHPQPAEDRVRGKQRATLPELSPNAVPSRIICGVSSAAR
jgi:hypothetical protein